MAQLISYFIRDFLQGLIDEVGGDLLIDIMPMAFYVENYLTSLGINLSSISKIFLDFGLSLIVLKFLKKGFDTYVLWTDGDPDAEPVLLVTGFFKAMAVALSIPILYGWLIDIINDLTNQVLNVTKLTQSNDLQSIVTNIATGDIFFAIAMLVFFLIYAFLYIQFIMKGLEILILRVGFPVACSGLMDAEQGVFKGYVQVLLQAALTVMVQVILAKISLVLILGRHIFFGIAAALLAAKTPRLLERFLITGGGGGSVMNTAYSTARLVQMIRKK
ncbi:MAG: hypothetical protein CVV02_01605 [Firmicutes bacterium HGW-Firmicutes-7]|nr:MAG: hypothetical protein CVV02_01605 [Firmicutes bacterium HGW-Firmicutes-7]